MRGASCRLALVCTALQLVFPRVCALAAVPTEAAKPAQDSMTVIAMGDWGGAGSNPHCGLANDTDGAACGSVHGSRWNMQTRVAKAMAAAGAAHVLALGDNFYEYGIQECSPEQRAAGVLQGCEADEHNFRFKMTYEDGFTTPHPELRVPWHLVTGNHDVALDPRTGVRGNLSAQIAYSYNSPAGRKGLWRFPARYHSWTSPLQTAAQAVEASARVVGQSSARFECVGDENCTRVAFINIDTLLLAGHCMRGYGNYAGPEGEEAERHWEWIERELTRAADVDYVLVAGHYPVYSACLHGPTRAGNFSERLAGMLRRHRATVYLAGHEHCTQYIREPDSGCGGHQVAYVVTGNVDDCCYGAPKVDQNPAGSVRFLHAGASDVRKDRSMAGAYSTLRFDAEALTVKIVDSEQKLLFTSEKLPPRSHVHRVQATCKSPAPRAPAI